jgi:hypothetical protein
MGGSREVMRIPVLFDILSSLCLGLLRGSFAIL